MNMGLELYNGDKGKPFKMGESPSFGTLASARGMAKLAAAMADRGQASNSTNTSRQTSSACFHIKYNIKTSIILQMPEGGPMLMSAETWDQFHGAPTKHVMFSLETNYTQGGVNLFG